MNGATAKDVTEPRAQQAVPLRRNRAYHLLWTGTTLSETGLNVSTLAFPLLALAATGSPGVAGAVSAVNALAQVVVGLPAGALVDRWDRKKIMVSCALVRAVTLGVLGIAVLAGHAPVWLLLATAGVSGAATSLFDPAERASLPSVVSREQLPTALSVNTARMHLGQLAGTSGGGFLFGLGRAVPFLADAVAHLLTFVVILFVRLPVRARVRTSLSTIPRTVVDGFAFMARQPFLRSTTLLLTALNLLFQALYLVVVVAAKQSGTGSGQVGVMAAMFGAGGLVGALLAPRISRSFKAHQAIAGIIWLMALLVPLMALTDEVMVWGLLLAGMAFLAPTAYTVIGTQQILLTPDGMRGRLNSANNLFNGAAQAAGAGLGGLLAQWLTTAQAILVCAAALVLLGLAGTAAGSLRLPADGAADEEPAPDDAAQRERQQEPLPGDGGAAKRDD
ncbi:MFS transporter [Streptomyces sp. NPDC004111]|uniref:MFS transporter n=1 Tax=Streptomyces sp. NPDC004111 TaxID=3364690 RepID=UPI00367D9DA1